MDVYVKNSTKAKSSQRNRSNPKKTLKSRFFNFLTRGFKKIKGLIKTSDFVEQNRTLAILCHDVLAVYLSLPLALWLYAGEEIAHYPFLHILIHSIVLGFVALGVFLWSQLYKGLWRYVALKEFMTIAMTSTVIILIYLPLMLLMSKPVQIPRFVIVLVWLCMITLLAGSRFVYRVLRNRLDASTTSRFSPVPQSRILLVGVNTQTEHFIKEVENNAQSLYEIIGIVDDGKHNIGRYIHGIEVMGRIDDIPHIISHLNVQGAHPHHLVIADPDLKGLKLQKVLDLCSSFNIDLSRIPKLTDMNKANPHAFDLEPISVEDLLKRTQNTRDRKPMKAFIQNRRILITGGGGTIGRELARQIALLHPSNLTLMDYSESLLYRAYLELSEEFPDLSIKQVLADVTDAIRMQKVLAQEKPDIIFHAASLNKEPIAELNPEEAVLTNIIGTRNIAEAARLHKVKAMILLSTDKASQPTTVIGKTKRVSECLCQSFDKLNDEKTSTRFVVVRFSHVLKSNDSLAHLFRHQLHKGGPLTIPDKRMTRYFMPTHEAIELIIQSAVIGFKSSKMTGQIYVLTIGESVHVDHLARQMILLAGYKPDEDIKIEYTGQQNGEKLYEPTLSNVEDLQSTSCEGLMLATTEVYATKKIVSSLDKLEETARLRETEKVHLLLNELIPDYQSSTQKSSKK